MVDPQHGETDFDMKEDAGKIIARVSIGLPTRNSIRFLEARIDSILRQTFTDWHLVVVDGESTDGTFEYLSELAVNDPRIEVISSKPEGIYPAFNQCIELAKSEFFYMATSDDTMSEYCLEKLVSALDENLDCDIAHCNLRLLREDGCDGVDWWPVSSIFARSSGEWLGKRHRRMAPFDGMVCLLGESVYTSVTQLLVRRSLYERIGVYPTQWGSAGDFHWNLRAGLAASSVHVPDTWGGWRVHPEQATQAAGIGSREHTAKIEGMIDEVSRISNRSIAGPMASFGLRTEMLRKFLRHFDRGVCARERRIGILRDALRGSKPAWNYLASVVSGKRSWFRYAPQMLQRWLDRFPFEELPRR